MQNSRFLNLLSILILLSLETVGPSVQAEVKLHGFADAVGAWSSTDYTMPWIGNDGRDLNMDGATRLGLNLNANLEEHWDFAGQVVGRGEPGVSGQPGYLMTADWLFLTYRPADSWSVRAGRQIYPLFLYSEQIDVGFTYLWTRLPTVVYGEAPVKSFNGLSASYNYDFSNWRASLTLYGGTGNLNQVSPGIGGLDFDDKHVVGGYVTLTSEDLKFLMTYKRSHPIGTVFQGVDNGSGTQNQSKQKIDLGTLDQMSVGADYHLGHLEAIWELAHGKSKLADTFDTTGTYATLGYRLWKDRITPNFTYGKQWSNTSVTSHPDVATVTANGLGARQTHMEQTIAGVNFRVANSTVIKAEYEHAALAYRDTTLNFAVDTLTFSLDTVF